MTLILGDWLITNTYEAPKHQWGVRVVDDTITAAAPLAELWAQFPDDVIHDAAGCVIASGFFLMLGQCCYLKKQANIWVL